MRTPAFAIGGLLWVALVISSQAARAQADSGARTVDPQKAEAIRTLIELTRTTDLFLLGFEEALSDQQDAPGVPEGFMDRFATKIRENVPQFLEMLVPVYDQHLTRDEVTALIELYRSPLGETLLELQMGLATEVAAIGERWAMMIVGEVFTEMANKPPR